MIISKLYIVIDGEANGIKYKLLMGQKPTINGTHTERNKEMLLNIMSGMNEENGLIVHKILSNGEIKTDYDIIGKFKPEELFNLEDILFNERI